MFGRSIVSVALLALYSATAAAQQWMISGAVETTPCLVSSEAYLISLRWLQIFQTDKKGAGTGAALVDSTLAPNFTYYDEGASFGDPAAVYNSSSAVYDSVSGSGYSGSLVTNVQYSILYAFASCDIAVVRWQSNSLSAKSKGVTVDVGTPIEYKGTDYLQVDLTTRLIYNVTSSSDLVNYYSQLGDDVIANPP